LNAEECKTWLRYHCQLFPQFREWWVKNHCDELRDAWLDQLKRLSLEDANESSKMMLDGEFGRHPPQWEYNRLPSFLFSVNRGLRNARYEAAQRLSRAQERKERTERQAASKPLERTRELQQLPLTSSISQKELAAAVEKKKADPVYREETRAAVLKFIRRCSLEGRPMTAESGYVKRFGWALTQEDLDSLGKDVEQEELQR